MTTQPKNSPKAILMDILDKIKGNGNFVCSGTEAFVIPGLSVEGIPEEPGFPLNEAMATKLIGVAKKAPFGKGAQTVLDESVRKVWEIEPQAIRLENPEWQKVLSNILGKVKKGLGLEKNEIEAKLYKLLIYEKGSFFLPHKDSEKEAGMFGSLLVYLPSTYQGGQLEVRFDDQNTVIDFAGISNYNIGYAAFYADCEHEVKPLESGYRICLAYNLIHKKGVKTNMQAVSAERDKVADCLKRMENEPDFPKILLLGHQYTPANFTMEALKLNDRPKAQVFLQAAEKAGYYAKPMLYTSYQAGQLETEDYDWDYRRRRYDDKEDDLLSGTMGDIFDEYLEIRHWMPGDLPGLTKIDAEDITVLSSITLNEGEPIEKDAEGYTGNAGMEMYYWYHYGAICFWPKAHHIDILKEQDLANRLEWVAYYSKDWNAENIQWVTQLSDMPVPHDKQKLPEASLNPLAEYLVVVKDNKRFSELSAKYFQTYFTCLETEHWLNLIDTYPPNLFIPIFSAILENGDESELNSLLSIFSALLRKPNQETSWIIELMNMLPQALQRINPVDYKRRQKPVLDIFEQTLFVARSKEDDLKWLHETGKAILKDLNSAYIGKIVIPALNNQSEKSKLLEQDIRKVCVEFLENKVQNKPKPPQNWRRDCPKEMIADKYYSEEVSIICPFLENAVEYVMMYRKRQADRDKMQELIKNYKLDLNTATIRKGSPYILQLTKNQASYLHAMEIWEEERGFLKEVGKIKVGR